MSILSEDDRERQDFVDGVLYKMLVELASKKLDWDIGLIGVVREAIGDEFVKRGIMAEEEFYPFVEG